MKYVTYSVPVLILLLSFFYNTNPFIVKAEANQAFDYLRTHRSALQWNDTLAKVAEAKAMDMARRRYESAVDPNGYSIDHYIEESGYESNSYAEFLQLGALSGAEAIQTLAKRHELLKADDSKADVGIGFVKCDVGKNASYACIIIAKPK